MSKIQALLAFAFSLHMAYDKAQSDGKIDINDVTYLMDPAMKVVPAVNSAKEALVEFKALDDVKRGELNEWVKASYDISDDELEAKIEAGFDLCFSIGVFLGELSKEEVEA